MRILCFIALYIVASCAALAGYAPYQDGFTENKGQWDSRASFLARGGGMQYWISSGKFLFELNEPIHASALDIRDQNSAALPPVVSGHVVSMEFLGSASSWTFEKKSDKGSKHNYLIGNNESNWVRNCRTYEMLVVRDVWPGVDMQLDTDSAKLRYTFVVGAGVDPYQIMFKFDGSTPMQASHNAFLLPTSVGYIKQTKLQAWQIIGGVKKLVACAFQVSGDTVSFSLGKYNKNIPLVIDPLVGSTYLGGVAGDEGWAVDNDTDGNVWVTGGTESSTYPTSTGAFQAARSGHYDVFVTKLSGNGVDLEYSTFVGGTAFDAGYGIKVDGSGNAYVGGVVQSNNFPTTPGAMQRMLRGASDGFGFKLSSDGTTLTYSTYIGGSAQDAVYAVALSGSNMVIGGGTTSGDFPIPPSAYQSNNGGAFDGFVARFNGTGTSISAGTLLGGLGLDDVRAVAVDNSNNFYATGQTASQDFPISTGAYDASHNSTNISDVFVAKVTSNGQALSYSTFLGGADTEIGYGIALDGNNAIVTGYTLSNGFPTTSGAYEEDYQGGEDCFVAKVGGTGTTLLWSTLLGGTNADQGRGVGLDDNGYIYVGGFSRSSNFPTTTDAAQTTNAGDKDAVVTKLSSNGSSVLYSTYVGGSGSDEVRGMSVDEEGNAVVCGITSSNNFPTLANSYDDSFSGASDAFVAVVGTGNPSLELLLPNGGEHWCAGTEQRIEWNGSSITFVTIEISSNGGGAYETLRDTIPAGGGYFDWIIPQDFSAGDQYRIRVKSYVDGTLSDASDNNFTVNVAPFELESAEDQLICIGQSAEFTVEASGLPEPTMQWQVSSDDGENWTDIAGATDPTLVVDPVQATQDGNLYRPVYFNTCLASGRAGEPARLIVKYQPEFVTHPEGDVLCAGESITLTTEANEAGVTYQWYRNGRAIPGAILQSLILNDVQVEDAGVYEVYVLGECPPAVVSNEALVEVQGVPLQRSTGVMPRAECSGQVIDSTIVIKNTGPMEITLTYSGVTDPAFSMIAPISNIGQTFQLAPGEEKELDVQFVPQRAGNVSGEFTFDVTPCDLDYSVTIVGGADSLGLTVNDVIEFEPIFQCDTISTTEFVVTNNGDTDLEVLEANLSNEQFKVLSPEMPFVLPIGESITVEVEFDSKGIFTGTAFSDLVFSCDVCSYELSTSLRAKRENISFAPLVSNVVFDTLQTCESGNSEEFSIRNNGQFPLTIIDMESSNSAFSAVKPTLPLTLAPGQNALVEVRFAGSTQGLTQGVLDIIAEECGVTRSLDLEGYRQAPVVAADISAAPFGKVLSCDQVRDTTIIITNHDNETTEIRNARVDAPFTIVSPSFPQMLEAGETLEVVVRFSPTVDGEYDSEVSLEYYNASCSDTLVIPVSGGRSTPRLNSEIANIDFPLLSSCDQGVDTLITISNPSDIEIQVERVESGSSFEVVEVFPFTLAVGEEKQVRIRFEPNNGNIVDDTLAFAIEPCGETLRVPVRGEKQGISYVLSDSEFEFGNIALCNNGGVQRELTIDITNEGAGNAVSTVASVHIIPAGSPYTVTGISTGDEIRVGDPIQATIEFTTNDLGDYSSELVIVFQPCGTERRIPLHASLQEMVGEFTSPSVDFGVVALGAIETQTLEFENTGTANLTIEEAPNIAAPFRIVATRPSLPATLLPNETLEFDIEFTATEGAHVEILQLFSTFPCEEVYSLSLMGVAANGPLPSLSSVVEYDFGSVVVGNNATRVLPLINDSDTDATISTTAIVGVQADQFDIVSIDAAVLKQSTGDYTLRFRPTTIGSFEAVAQVSYNGGQVAIILRGTGIDGNTTSVTSSSVTASPGTKNVALPLYIANRGSVPVDATWEWKAVVGVRASIYFPTGADKAVSESVQYDADSERWLITLSGTLDQDNYLGAVLGTATVGDTTVSSIDIVSFEFIQEPGYTVGRMPGRYTVDTDIVIFNAGRFGILSISPNPSTGPAEVVCRVIEKGNHVLEVYDMGGRLIWDQHFYVDNPRDPSGKYGLNISVRIEEINLVSGAYTVLLRTPGRTSSDKLIIAR